MTVTVTSFVKQLDFIIMANEGHIEKLVYLTFIKILLFNKTSSMTSTWCWWFKSCPNTSVHPCMYLVCRRQENSLSISNLRVFPTSCHDYKENVEYSQKVWKIVFLSWGSVVVQTDILVFVSVLQSQKVHFLNSEKWGKEKRQKTETRGLY